MQKSLYLDGTATTKPTKLALDAYNDICEHHWLNPSSTTYSVDAKNKLEEARDIISNWICCRKDQIFFTSGSTQGANWIIQTFAPRWNTVRGVYHYFTSKLEHSCVRNSLKFMARCGYEVDQLINNKQGLVDVDFIDDWLKYTPSADVTSDGQKCLVCVMDSNNELGTIEPTKQIAEICHKYGHKLMTDMTQSFANSPEIDVTHLGMDYAFGSAQKFGAPRGTGFMYVKDPTDLLPFMYGGHQENGLRGGTENLAGIYAMAVQFEEIASMRFVREKKIRELREYLLANLPDNVICNTGDTPTLASIVSLQIPVDANSMVTALSMKNIYISAGSACSTGENKASAVLKACGFTDKKARHTIRVSLNDNLTKEDIDWFIQCLKNCQQMLLQ